MFDQIRKGVLDRFKILSKSILFGVEVDRDKIWDIYINAIPEEYRQSNVCNCCRSFLRQFSGIVSVTDDFEIATLWDFDVEGAEYGEAIKAVRKYIRSLPISGLFLNSFSRLGTEKNPDRKRDVIWTHYYLDLPSTFVAPERAIGPAVGVSVDNKNVLKRSLEEITNNAVKTVIELINQGSLYRGNEFLPQVTKLNDLQIEYATVPVNKRDNFCWAKSRKVPATVSKIRNSAIGTLLQDLSDGKELDQAVTAFERVTAPTNYQRPKSLVTPRMVDEAKARIEELGLIESVLNRSQLPDTSLTAANAIFIHRETTKALDVFDQAKQTVVNPSSFSKVEEVGLEDFLNKVLPTSKSISILPDNSHLGNFVSLIGPKSGVSGNSSLFKWDNDFTWSYSGQVADSVRDRVKAAGGKVDGFLRISLSWLNLDDLDLHVIEPDEHEIYYGNRGVVSRCGGSLDVDMNVLTPVHNAVENVCYGKCPKDGLYRVIVNNFRRRQNTEAGFEIEIECNGESKSFVSRTNDVSRSLMVTFQMDKGKISFNGGKLIHSSKEASYISKEKWGVKTGQFHKVKAITLSPNHWTSKIGNRHVFFIIDKCVSDEKLRPFYNEFLNERLSKDRKVFEVLGDKIEVEKVENELSGLGFSDTLRNSVILQVEGSFKRVIKVMI
jgi:hypothetical protein